MTGALVILLLVVVGSAIWFLRSRPIAAVAVVAAAAFPMALGSTGGALVSATLVWSIVMAQPLYVALGALTVMCFEFLLDHPPHNYGIFPEKIFELTDKNVLLAIPFFVVSGGIMSKGGIARALIEFARDLTRWVPGGLGIAAVGGCVLFAAISGSSPVTVIAIGGMMYPALVKAGFGERPSMGLLTSAGSLGIVIPPSIPMIIYAIAVSGRQSIDVGDLFLAGLGPGLLIGLLLAGIVIGRALRTSDDLKRDLTGLGKGLLIIVPLLGQGLVTSRWLGGWAHAIGPAILALVAVAYAWRSFIRGFWALMLPVIILGGIYSGIFSPTNAAAVAVVYALVVAIYVHRELTWKDIPELVVESTVLMGALIVIMVVAFVFNDFLVEAEVPDRAVAWLDSMQLSRGQFLIALNIFLLIVGCFMDIISAILIIAPLVVPMAMAPGIDVDPIHLGIIFIVNLELGYLTPPLGLNLFVASTLFKKPLGEVVKAVLPYTAAMLVGIIGITYIPSIALGPGQWIASLSQPKAAPATSTDLPPEPGQGGKVLSIEDLMKQQLEQPDPATDAAKPPTGKVLSIEELMNSTLDDDEAPEEDATPDSGKVKSIEELMNDSLDDQEADKAEDKAEENAEETP